MKNYELLYILSSSMTSKEIKDNFLEIKKNIIKLKGEMLETLLNHPFLLKSEVSKDEEIKELKDLPITKRRLAYPVEKNKVGFYCLVNFKSDPENINEINDYLRMNKNVLRHLITQEDPMNKEGLKKLQGLFARKRAEQEKEKKEVEETERKEKTRKIEKERALEKKKIVEEKKVVAEKKEIQKEIEKEKVEPIKEKTVEKKIKDKTIEKKEEKKEERKKEETTSKGKKKIRLEDLEDKLDEILEDTMI